MFPPKRTSPVGTIYDTLDGLQGLDPDFISVTYGTGKSSDRTLTARIAHTVNEYGIPAVAHLTAQYLDKTTMDEALDLFDQAKVSGVLALRGDRVEGAEPGGSVRPCERSGGLHPREASDCKIYGACYPEKHPQAATLEEDIDNLKKKVDAGVSHLISQLFYDNEDFLRFVDEARAAGIARSDRSRHHAGDERRNRCCACRRCASRACRRNSPSCLTSGEGIPLC